MKQAILELKKKLLLVERNPESVFVNDLKEIPFRLGKMLKLTDITEEQYKQWVDKNRPNYCFNDGKFKIKCKTAKESFFSYLESKEIYFENPLPKPADDDFSFYADKNLSVQEEWREAQKNVWDINRCWLFEVL